MRTQRRLTRAHVHTTAQCLNVSERTVWRWLADATTTPASAARPGARRADRFEITDEIRGTLTVTDPMTFANTLATGIGRGRAYSTGLILVRDASTRRR
ncbi:type I-E CRISPR-associated protein Cas6/Cse3/CasE [Streptomyces sp. AV19]|nr:type I-E CRISPR-associated protein Cas6/Cse3/CasE [Streptomyces sp. AV19]